jgi:excisionase family DNA binding protein
MASATVESPAVPAANPAANSLLLNFKQASPLLGLTEWQIRGLVAAGELPVVRVGKKLYLRRTTINRWVERAEGKHRAQTYQRRGAS